MSLKEYVCYLIDQDKERTRDEACRKIVGNISEDYIFTKLDSYIRFE